MTEWIFEPNGGFRSNIGDEPWPLGYISEGPGNPIFELNEVLGDKSVKELVAAARLATAAPKMLDALQLVLDTYGFDSSTDSSIWQTVVEAIGAAKGEPHDPHL